MTTHGPIYKMIVEKIEKENCRVSGTVWENKATMLAEILPKIQELEPRWIPVSETYPSQDETVILSDGKAILRGVYLEEYKSFGYYKGGESEDDWEFIRFGNKISHWMELPLPNK